MPAENTRFDVYWPASACVVCSSSPDGGLSNRRHFSGVRSIEWHNRWRFTHDFLVVYLHLHFSCQAGQLELASKIVQVSSQSANTGASMVKRLSPWTAGLGFSAYFSV